jgi:PAS domain S-box-containing protein
MQTESVRVLLVDDDEEDYILTRSLIKEFNNNLFHIEWVSTFEAAEKVIQAGEHDIYLIDYRLGVNTGIDLLKKAISMGCTAPIIMLTGKGDQKIDVEAMEAGAADYLVKDKIDAFILERSMRYAIDRVKGLEAIVESENKYRSIFEKSRDVIYITSKEGKFIDINDAAVKLFGYSIQELLGLNVRQLYSNEQDRENFKKAIEQTGEVIDLEVTLKSKSGEKIYCLLNAGMQFGKDNKEGSYQGIIHDITKRKLAEQQLMSSEKMAVTGRIARSIAHEVRNPLTNVFLSLEQVRNEVNETVLDKEALEMYFEIISRNCERINVLITELLNSSKPITLSTSTFPINKVLDESLELGIDRARLKKITVQKNYGAAADDVISVDMEKIKIALLNIIINAIEAMESLTGVLTLTTETKGKSCAIIIADNGPGISKENMPKLFEPFFSKKAKGVGLGLTSTQNIILNHNGTIDVESEEGVGTKFIIKFNRRE